MVTKTKQTVTATTTTEPSRSDAVHLLAEENARERMRRCLAEAERERRVSHAAAVRRAERRARKAKDRLVRLKLRSA